MPNLPAPPQTFTTPYTLPTGGTTWHVHAGDNLQTTLDAAALGDVIILDAGATFTGNFKLPIKSGNSWLYIISSDLASLPEGFRVGPSSVSHMATLASPSGSNLPIITSYKGAHHYRFVGIEFKVSTSISMVNTILIAGYGSANYTDSLNSWVVSSAQSDADLPHHFTIDRCYIHSLNSYPTAARCGVLMSGHYMASIDSYYKNFIDSSDSQAINIIQGTGPFKIVNNYLEAAGENFFVGGTDPSVIGALPADIEFRGNYCYKDSAAWGTHWTIKNLFELKYGRRILCTGNLMENCYRDDQGQSATAIVLTVRDQGGGNTAAQLQDITVTNNRVHTAGIAWRITGYDDVHTSQQTQRILIENNAVDNLSYTYSTNAKGEQISSVVGPALDITIRHNLVICNDNYINTLETLTAPTSVYAVKNLTFENNIYSHGQYGLVGTSVAEGNATLARYSDPTGLTVWRKNVVIKTPIHPSYASTTNAFFAANYPPGNGLADNNVSVGFINYSLSNYVLTSFSPYHNWGSDGTDPGPNWTALNLAIAHARDGQAGTITLVAPQNFAVVHSI